VRRGCIKIKKGITQRRKVAKGFTRVNLSLVIL
jgi:hypothetical protein